MKHTIHRPSWLIGVITGLLLGIAGCMFLVKHIAHKMELDDLRQDVSQAVTRLDSGFASSPVDVLANTYGHCRMGMYSDQALQKQIEDAASRHPELQKAIEERREWWEKD